MRQLLLTCVAAGAFSLASAAAKADVVVYNGGAPNLASAFVADSDASIAVYISFVLPAGERILSRHFTDHGNHVLV